MPLTLTVTGGPHKGRSFTFGEHDTFVVGRSPDAHLSLADDPYFSRHHFLVEANPPLSRLFDLDSHNGTIVNGKKVAQAPLRHGDVIQGGQTTLEAAWTEVAGDPNATQELSNPKLHGA